MRRIGCALLGAWMLVSACSQEGQENVASQESQSVATEAVVHGSGVAAVEFDDSLLEAIGDGLQAGGAVTKSASLNAALSGMGAVSIVREFPDAGEREPLHREYGLHRWYIVKYSNDTPATKAAEELSAVEGVLRVVPKLRMELRSMDDTYLGNQWGMYNSGKFARGAKKGFDIGMMKVWNDGGFALGSEDVIVSVVDGGIAMDHEDLAANVIPGGEDGSWNFVDSSATIVAHDHGTHVAGVIAAVGNNAKGIAGIAGGDAAAGVPGVRLLSCQIFRTDEKTGQDYSAEDAAEAIVWGADHGAVISQNSWGFSADLDEDGKISEMERKNWYSYKIDDFPDLKAAIDYFVDNAGYDSGGKAGGRQVGPMAGGLVMFAAGNDGIGYDPIGHYENVIAVGAVECSGSSASYSNHDDDHGDYGKWLDICAPGTDVASTIANGYAYMSGTSMACPHVSGVAALVLANRGGAGFTNSDLKDILLGSANSALMEGGDVGPMLDAYAALMYGTSDVPSAVSSFSAAAEENSITCTWKAVKGEKHLSYDYMLLASKDKEALAKTDPSNPGGGVVAKSFAADETIAEGDELSEVIDGLDFGATYYIAVAAADASGDWSKLSEILAVETEYNAPPIITVKGTVSALHAYESAEVPFSVKDEHGDAFEVALGGSEAVSLVTLGSGSYKLVINAMKSSAGSHEAVITATDVYGGSSSVSVPYTVMENQAPQTTGSFGNIILTRGGNEVLSAVGKFSDPDGETLDISVSVSDESVLSYKASGEELVINGKSYGVAEVTVTATDDLGATAKATFKALVRDAGVEAEVYPNPVSTTLHVRTGLEETQTLVKIVSSTGSVVYEGDALSGAFNPMSIDVSGLAPGTYRVWVSYGNASEDFVIVKR